MMTAQSPGTKAPGKEGRKPQGPVTASRPRRPVLPLAAGWAQAPWLRITLCFFP